MYKDNKKDHLNLMIILLSIVLFIIIIIFSQKYKPKEQKITEEDYRNAIRANIIEEYITNPQEKENAMMQQQEEEKKQIEENKIKAENENQLGEESEKFKEEQIITVEGNIIKK